LRRGIDLCQKPMALATIQVGTPAVTADASSIETILIA